ncbi:DUF3782 domain-containing protein [Thermoflexus sp.]|uniref:DUF3782 domain-containing protein n=1 Tax=Thermoflexus sp. TaxID=1969742 RepID=UPI0035E425EA
MTPQMIEELLQDPVFRMKFLELLDRDPAFREEVRRKLLTEDLLALPAQVERLRLEIHEEFERVWEVLGENSRQIAALTERMEKVEAQIAALTEEMRELRRVVGRIEERWGLVHENMAEDLMPRFLALTGRQVRRSVMVQFDGEADLVLEVEETDGRRITMIVEVKGRIWGRRPFEQALERIRDPGFQSWLQREGFPEPVVPAVFGLAVYAGADAIAGDLGVGLYEARRGEVVPPQTTAGPWGRLPSSE